MSTRIGAKIRELRRERRLTLDELAVAAGMSKSYIWELENRPSANPSAEKLDALARVLGCPASYFLDNTAGINDEEQLDQAFFRNFKDLAPEDREMVRKIVDSFRKR